MTGVPVRVADIRLGDVDALCALGAGRFRVLFWHGAMPVGELHLVLSGRRVDAAAVAGEAAVRFGLPAAPASGPRAPVTVAIPTHQRAGALARCLDGLLAQEPPTVHEILVVDNAPTDRTTEALARMRGVRYVREDLPGQNFARNRALAEAGHDVVAFLDDDTAPARGWLAAVSQTFGADPALAAAGGPMLPAELETDAQRLFEAAGGFPQRLQAAVYDARPPAHADGDALVAWPLTAGYLFGGANLAVRRSELCALGGFDEALDTVGLPGGGDTDVVFRLLAAGRRIAWVPPMLVRHWHRRVTSELRAQLRHSWSAGNVAFLCKHRRDPRWRARAQRALRRALRDHLAQALASLAGRGLPAHLTWARLLGCLEGVVAYERSARRARRLRA